MGHYTATETTLQSSCVHVHMRTQVCARAYEYSCVYTCGACTHVMHERVHVCAWVCTWASNPGDAAPSTTGDHKPRLLTQVVT